MTAALPTRRRLFAGGAAATYVVVFAVFLVWERPGLGVGHFYYLAIALLALAGGPVAGAAGGVLATALFSAGVLVNDQLPTSDLVTYSTPIRLVTFVGIGTLLGWYASHYRERVAELRVLAERDQLTGLPNTRGFEAAVSRRLAEAKPFGLLAGDLNGLRRLNVERGGDAGDDELQRVARVLEAALGPEDDIARVGGDEFVVLTPVSVLDDLARLAVRLETQLTSDGAEVTFGWSAYPQEGDNGLALYRAADERLYARKLLRGQTTRLSLSA